MLQREEARRLPGIFEKTIFSPGRRDERFDGWRDVARSVFIKAMHPKTEISPSRAAVEKMLKAGWVGQMKIHGHRAQIHLPSASNDGAKVEPIAYNRQGRPHGKLLPDEITAE